MTRAATLSLLICAACVPARYESRPHSAGVVVDAVTGEAIAGATVCVETWLVSMPLLEPYKVSESATLSTDAAGKFEIEQVHSLAASSARCCDRGPAPRWNRLVIAREGYQTLVFGTRGTTAIRRRRSVRSRSSAATRCRARALRRWPIRILARRTLRSADRFS